MDIVQPAMWSIFASTNISHASAATTENSLSNSLCQQEKPPAM